MRLMTVIFLLALITPAALARPFDSPALAQGRQPAVTGARTLRGFVTTSSDVPLARVRVAVTNVRPTEPPVLTDDRGQFSVRVPDTESVRLTFAKARYAVATLDIRRSDINLQGPADLRVRLSLGGAISGQVRDQYGAPVMLAAVTARRLGSVSPADAPVLVASTNDLGEFRFGGLAAGAYSLAARPPASPNTVAAAGEQSVNVSLGAEVSGIDFLIEVASEVFVRNADRTPLDPSATGTVRGRVSTPLGAAVGGAVVQAYGPDSSFPAVESDARGRYTIDQLPPGDYRILAFKRGFIAPRPGQGQSAVDYLLSNTSTQDRILQVGRGQTVESIDLTLGRGASIAGTIVDEFGEPMQDVAVSALELRAMSGRTRAFRPSGQGNAGRTDDRGRYRLYGLQPGTYVVQAVANDQLSPQTGYVRQFYPGTPVIDLATPTKLDVDAAAQGVDLSLRPGPTGRVRGTVLDPAGDPVRATLALTVSSRSGAIQTESVRVTANDDGTFAFINVPPGEYLVQATATGTAVPGANVAVTDQFVAALVTVADGDSPPLQLKLSRGALLRGRVVYEGIAEPPPPYSGLSLNLQALSADSDRDPLVMAGGSTGYALLSDQTFEYWGIFGRSLLVSELRSPEWYLKSITYRGENLADSPFDFGSSETFRDIEVVVSAGAARLTGRATDDRAAPVRDYSVVAFATDRSKWTLRSRWLRSSPSARDGSFRLTGLVPGDYWVVAVNRLEGSDVAGDLQNPDVLDALASRAVRVSLGEGQSQDLTLRLMRR